MSNNASRLGCDVLVIGGGASGMMAAYEASSRGKSVILLEKNRKLGKKLSITGGTRCNITNAELDIRKLLIHYGKSEQFLYAPFSQFGVHNTFEFFAKKGLPLVIEDRKRAFPYTHKAEDVVTLFRNLLKKTNVDVRLGEPVTALNTEVTGMGKRIESVSTLSHSYYASSVILATGGLSYPDTGSSGDGFKWARDMGHCVKSADATLVPLLVSDAWVKEQSGRSIDNCKIVFVGKENKITLEGRVLFTHTGLSGPLILNASGNIKNLLKRGDVVGCISPFPQEDGGMLERRFIEIAQTHPNKTVRSILKILLPSGFLGAFTHTLPPSSLDGMVHSLTKEARREIITGIHSRSFCVTGTKSAKDAIVADGGVELTDIDTRSMRSRIIENLYITGDLLHIRRPSGGYSLQLCWTTGVVAGRHA